LGIVAEVGCGGAAVVVGAVEVAAVVVGAVEVDGAVVVP
jgi:hypothetical protein